MKLIESVRTSSTRVRVIAGAVIVIIVVFGFFVLRSKRNAVAPSRGSDGVATTQDSVVVLDSTAQRLAGLEIVRAMTAEAGALTANGTIAFNENQVSIIAPRAEGRVVAVRADLGQSVTRGTPLAELSSAEIGQIRGEYERARAGLEIAQRNYQREKRLFEQSISPEKEMLEAEQTYRQAQADLRSTAARLSSMGASGGQGAAYTLSSPISGVILERSAMPGQIVGPQTNLFTVANLNHVWITVDIYDADLARVQTGALASVTATALPGENFIGRVTYAGGVVDPATHTFKVRVEVENPRLRLRPGMFAQVRIEAPAQTISPRVVVPEVAIQDLNGAPVVFVAIAPGRFVARKVVAGPRVDSARVSIAQGVKPGEQIVVRGAFQLKAQITKSSFGEED